MQTQPTTPAGLLQRVVSYRRVSHSRQERGASLETQLEAAQAYCAERGWAIVADIVETHTAEDIWERDGLTRARELVRTGEADILLFYAVDRLTRNQYHIGIVMDEAERYGGAVDFVSEEFESTPVGKAVLSIRAMAAELEREKLIERTQRGMRKRLQNGLLKPGRRPPYGYRWQGERKERLVPDPETAPIARRILEAAARGDTTRSIALALTRDGVPPPSGTVTTWMHSSVRHILNNPVYCGEPQAYKTRLVVERDCDRGTKRKVQKVRPAEERVTMAGVAEPLIDRVMFDQIHERLRRNREQAARNNANPDATLLRAGYVRCGLCGRGLIASWHKYRGTYGYRCGRSMTHGDCPGVTMDAHLLDPEVWAYVERLITDDDAIDREFERLRASAPTDHDAAAVESRLAEVERQQQRLARTIAQLDDDDATAPLLSELRSLAQQRKALESDRETFVARRRGWEAAQTQLRVLQQTWREEWKREVRDFTCADRRRALDVFGIQVRVYRKEHQPRWEITTAIDIVDSSGNTTTSARTANGR